MPLEASLMTFILQMTFPALYHVALPEKCRRAACTVDTFLCLTFTINYHEKALILHSVEGQVVFWVLKQEKRIPNFQMPSLCLKYFALILYAWLVITPSWEDGKQFSAVCLTPVICFPTWTSRALLTPPSWEVSPPYFAFLGGTRPQRFSQLSISMTVLSPKL